MIRAAPRIHSAAFLASILMYPLLSKYFLLYTKREARLQATLRSLNHPTIIERSSSRAIISSMMAVIRSMITAIFLNLEALRALRCLRIGIASHLWDSQMKLCLVYFPWHLLLYTFKRVASSDVVRNYDKNGKLYIEAKEHRWHQKNIGTIEPRTGLPRSKMLGMCQKENFLPKKSKKLKKWFMK